MVLDAGRIVSYFHTAYPFLSWFSYPQVEFDEPSELFEISGSYLDPLVEESGDKEALYAATGASAAQS
jgi:hypothetical protein